MPQFDPRRKPVRYAPRLLSGAVVAAVLAPVWHMAQAEPTPVTEPTVVRTAKPLDPLANAALEHQAFAVAEARTGYAPPEKVTVKVRSGESLEKAVTRAGVNAGEAHAFVRALGQVYDPSALEGGAALEAAVAKPQAGEGPVKLIGLSMRTGPVSAVTVSKTWDGALRLRELEEKVRDETMVAEGEMSGSLQASAERAGANSTITRQLVKVFSHKLDFSRDLRSGDRFRLVFDRTLTESGRVVKTGDLLYAEVQAKGRTTRFYRFVKDGRAQYFDEHGRNIRGFLLRTPVDGARMTSRFGLRLHPILNYLKMHQGIDFAAGTGTPVLAASDGVVVEARRWGGYGNWLRIRHANGYETGYAHLSGYAVRTGQRVAQGQLVGYVGSTGRSTGPHLHYEVWKNGARVNPTGAKVPTGTILEGRELVAFHLQKAKVEAALAGVSEKAAPRLLDLETPSVQEAALRPSQGSPRA
jgi:murein DD-endopeptidase MepM/ murein hydrolase activator NlpD